MQFKDAQQANQTLKDNNLDMKKEQRQVLDELEKQLSSLISEKEKLEERQVISTSNTKLTRSNKSKHSRGKRHAFATQPALSFPKSCDDSSQDSKDSYNKFNIQH